MKTLGGMPVSDELVALLLKARDQALDGVANGEPLIPFVLLRTENGVETNRLMGDDLSAIDRLLQSRLNKGDVKSYAFASDATVTEGERQQKAILIEGAEMGSPKAVLLAQEYQPDDSEEGFAVLGHTAAVELPPSRLPG